MRLSVLISFEIISLRKIGSNITSHCRMGWQSLRTRSFPKIDLLNELGKRDKMRGLPSILSLFRNEFNKFNNTSARMLDSIYLSYDIKLISRVKTL